MDHYLIQDKCINRYINITPTQALDNKKFRAHHHHQQHNTAIELNQSSLPLSLLRLLYYVIEQKKQRR